MMQRSIGLNALLAAVVAALGAWVYFTPAKDAPVEHPLSALKPAEARSIHIERPGAAPTSLEKKAGAWLMTAPFAARGDESRVQRLLEILEAKSAHRLAAADLARFELDQPRARVTIGGQAFSFGMVSPMTREQYVLTDGAVYAISPRYGSALPARAAELANRQLFGAGESPVRMEFKTFTVEQRDGKWRQTPDASDLSQDDFVRWVDEWRNATALRAGPGAATRSRDEIKVQLKNAGGFTLGVLSREPELVLLRADEKLQYHFRAEAAKRLLSPPGAEQPKNP
jgi:hypothetical protein